MARERNYAMRTQFQIPREVSAPEASSEPSETDLRLLQLALILAERWGLIATAVAIAGVIGIALALLLPVRYTAEITVLPPQQESSGLSSMLSAQLGGLGSLATLAGGDLGLKNRNDMYVSMFKSHVVEDAIIRHFGLQQEYGKLYLSDARKMFEKRTAVEGGRKDGLIHISVEDHDPRRAAEIANGYVEQFRTLSQHLAISEASQRRAFLEGQVDLAKKKLSDAEEAMKNTQQKTGLIALDSQARALIESAAYLRAQIAAKQVQIEAMRSYATDQNAGVAQAQQELAGMRAQMQKLTGSQDINGMILPKGQVSEAGLEYIRKMRDMKYYEAEYSLLTRQLDLAKLDEAREGSMVQVVDPAVPPDKRSFPQRTLMVLAAVMAGLFLGMLAALTNARYQRMKSDPRALSMMERIRLALRRRRTVS
jgi:tyrosine-protein kinase Etk/Wzc